MDGDCTIADIFIEDFETGDFSLWVGTIGTPVIVANPVHHGSNAAQFDALNDWSWKTWSAESTVYARTYHRWTTEPTSGSLHSLFYLDETGGNSRVEIFIYNDGGTVKWRLRYLNDDPAWINITPATPNPVVDTWYCVEARWSANTANGAQLWVDSNLIATAADTTYNDDLTRIRLGALTLDSANTITADCLHIADARVTCESTVSIPCMMHHYNRIKKKIRG